MERVTLKKPIICQLVKKYTTFSGNRNLRETGWGSVDWIHLAQNMNQWRALVNTAMKLRVS
jgi:hypothetical protein